MAATPASTSGPLVLAPPSPARIGPNALLQTRDVVRLLYGPSTWTTLQVSAHLPAELPQEMVSERLFQRLVHSLVAEFGTETATRILRRSGEQTADYVRRNRIPTLARALLGILPGPLATRLLLQAIHRHGWTFLGSGRMEHDAGRIVLHECVTCRDVTATHPMGGFYAGAFQGLLESLADRRIRVTETECMAQGAPSCVFIFSSSV